MLALRSTHKLGFVVPVIAVWVCAGASAAGRGGGASVSAQRGFTTGSDAHLRNAADGVADRSELCFRVTPVAPYAGLSYPPGTSLDENAGTMTSPGGGHRVWFEVYMSNFAGAGNGILGTFQWNLGPDFALPAGLSRPHQPCTDMAECTAAGFGFRDGSPGAPTLDYGCPYGGTECNPAIAEVTRPDYPSDVNFPGGLDLPACTQTNLGCADTKIGTPSMTDPGIELYLGTLILDLDAAATGTITLQLQGINIDTFFSDGAGNTIPITKTGDAVIDIPLGRCCELDGTCSPDVTRSECHDGPPFFAAGTPCPADGGPACCECVTDLDCWPFWTEFGHCNIGTCINSCICVFNPIPGWEPGGPVCCDPATGFLADRIDGNPCTLDVCSIDDEDSLGVPPPDPDAEGMACIDGDSCTGGDACSNGVCVGDDVNGQPCTSTADCQSNGQAPDAICVDGTCFCGDDVAIPTVSEWGLVVLTLLLLVGAKTAFRHPVSTV